MSGRHTLETKLVLQGLSSDNSDGQLGADCIVFLALGRRSSALHPPGGHSLISQKIFLRENGRKSLNFKLEIRVKKVRIKNYQENNHLKY